jgi:hypothetical protein
MQQRMLQLFIQDLAILQINVNTHSQHSSTFKATKRPVYSRIGKTYGLGVPVYLLMLLRDKL